MFHVPIYFKSVLQDADNSLSLTLYKVIDIMYYLAQWKRWERKRLILSCIVFHVLDFYNSL